VFDDVLVHGLRVDVGQAKAVNQNVIEHTDGGVTLSVRGD
jgi:hypothetical protein